ncbi:hypothetical protein [Kitasatospora sp. MMS16-BH015]|nr:hypothetical protein [Kitasatospora sp. MMS16-BH015]
MTAAAGATAAVTVALAGVASAAPAQTATKSAAVTPNACKLTSSPTQMCW